jgi:hypothetical protein
MIPLANFRKTKLIWIHSAEEALSRAAEVDVKGGWKIGDPYVVSRSLTFYLHSDSVECPTLH